MPDHRKYRVTFEIDIAAPAEMPGTAFMNAGDDLAAFLSLPGRGEIAATMQAGRIVPIEGSIGVFRKVFGEPVTLRFRVENAPTS
jgi:hypothetical protein